jgi:DNA-binding transcriptional ArsR family regulator
MHADVFQMLADPTRRHIVEVLRGGECAVNDIVDAVDIDQSGGSRLFAPQRVGLVTCGLTCLLFAEPFAMDWWL